MKAIDFACRFLINIAVDPLPPSSRLVLVTVAAGLDVAEDISRLTGMTPGVCVQLLRQLEKRGLLKRRNREAGFYALSESGKDYIGRLLSFIPHERS